MNLRGQDGGRVYADLCGKRGVMRIYLLCLSSISPLAMPVYMKVRGKYIFLPKLVVIIEGIDNKSFDL